MIKIGKVNFAPKELIIGLIAFVTAGASGAVYLQRSFNTSAVTPEFDAGRIMDDAVMANYNSMSVSQIQKFLESKNNCNDYNTSKADRYSKYKFNIRNGKFVCLHEEKFDGKSAAEIIYEVSQKYRINPQVLIVLIQKEQSLVTDTWPNNIQYRSATGFGCPDTAECDSKYYGFKNQIDNAAKLFREVLDGGYTNFPLGNNSINYHPSNSCGRSTVKIKTLATSALYRYTPYQPNSAALKAGYGQGNDCSAYGNRNFFKYFNDWFGSTITNASKSNNVLTSVSGRTIDSGIYYILSEKYGNKPIDIAGNGTKNLANAQLEPIDKTSSQQFYAGYSYLGGYYVFMNMNSGKNLNMYDARLGSNIHQYKDTGNCDERWYLEKTSSGKIKMLSACDRNLAVNVENKNGTLNVFAGAASAAEEWSFVREKDIDSVKSSGATHTASSASSTTNNSVSNDGIVDGATYYLVSKVNNNYGLDITWNAKNSGDMVQLWNSNGTAVQQFVVRKKAGTNKYELMSVNSGLYVDAVSAGRTKGTRVHQWQRNGTCAQEWSLEKQSDGYYKIRSGCSNLVLDIWYARMQDGTVVCLWNDQNLDAQKWKLVKK